MAPINAARVSRRAFLGVLGTVAIAAALPPAVTDTGLAFNRDAFERVFPSPGEWEGYRMDVVYGFAVVSPATQCRVTS